MSSSKTALDTADGPSSPVKCAKASGVEVRHGNGDHLRHRIPPNKKKRGALELVGGHGGIFRDGVAVPDALLNKASSLLKDKRTAAQTDSQKTVGDGWGCVGKLVGLTVHIGEDRNDRIQ